MEEVMHLYSIYEKYIVTFSGFGKVLIDSRFLEPENDDFTNKRL